MTHTREPTKSENILSLLFSYGDWAGPSFWAGYGPDVMVRDTGSDAHVKASPSGDLYYGRHLQALLAMRPAGGSFRPQLPNFLKKHNICYRPELPAPVKNLKSFLDSILKRSVFTLKNIHCEWASDPSHTRERAHDDVRTPGGPGRKDRLPPRKSFSGPRTNSQ